MAMFYDTRDSVICSKCNSSLFEEIEVSMYEKTHIKTEDMLIKDTISKHLKCIECGTVSKEFNLLKYPIITK